MIELSESQITLFKKCMMQLNMITVGQTITDHINRMVTITEDLTYIKDVIENYLRLG